MFQNYYEILEVAQTATAEEIKQAFKRLARKHHPDVNKAPDAEEKFKAINAAYERLKDSEGRARYDQFLRAVGNGEIKQSAIIPSALIHLYYVLKDVYSSNNDISYIVYGPFNKTQPVWRVTRQGQLLNIDVATSVSQGLSPDYEFEWTDVGDLPKNSYIQSVVLAMGDLITNPDTISDFLETASDNLHLWEEPWSLTSKISAKDWTSEFKQFVKRNRIPVIKEGTIFDFTHSELSLFQLLTYYYERKKKDANYRSDNTYAFVQPTVPAKSRLTGREIPQHEVLWTIEFRDGKITITCGENIINLTDQPLISTQYDLALYLDTMRKAAQDLVNRGYTTPETAELIRGYSKTDERRKIAGDRYPQIVRSPQIFKDQTDVLGFAYGEISTLQTTEQRLVQLEARNAIKERREGRGKTYVVEDRNISEFYPVNPATETRPVYPHMNR